MENRSTTVITKNNQQKLTDKQPRRLTIEFIKQFARAYVHEPRLNAGIGSIMVN